MSNCFIACINKKDIAFFICLFLSVVIIMHRDDTIAMLVSSNYPSLIIFNCFFVWLFKKNLIIQAINYFIITRNKYHSFIKQIIISNICFGIGFTLIFTLFIPQLFMKV